MSTLAADSTLSPRMDGKPIGFESEFPLAWTQTGDNTFRVLCTMTYRGRWQTFTVPGDDTAGEGNGQETDLGSSPQTLQSVFPTYGRHTSPVILHDRLWRELVPSGLLTYREADAILRQAMGTLGVQPVRKWSMWAAVRWGSLLTRWRHGGHKEWWRDALPVLAITGLMLPLVVGPALANRVSLVLLGFMEGVVELGKQVRWSLTHRKDEDPMHIEDERDGDDRIDDDRIDIDHVVRNADVDTEVIKANQQELSIFQLEIPIADLDIVRDRAQKDNMSPNDWILMACENYAHSFDYDDPEENDRG